MEREPVGAWLDGYGRAWEQADPPAVLGLFTPDATYRAHPLGRAYTGHDAIADYWTRATAGQRDIQVRFGDPIVDGDRVATPMPPRPIRIRVSAPPLRPGPVPRPRSSGGPPLGRRDSRPPWSAARS